MSGYLAMYRATSDTDFLRRCAVRIDNVQQQRDDRRHRLDYRNVAGATWAATKYSVDNLAGTKPAYAWIVLDGMITYPMADFAQIIVSDPALHDERTTSGETFLHAAQRIASEVAQTIQAHDDQWDDKHHVYRVRSDAPIEHPGVILPHNQYAAMGRTLLAMHGATGDKQYQYKAIWLASYFHENLVCKEDGSYVWHYAPPGSHIEDISHGAIEVDFAVLCEGHGIIFDATDLARFASTFVKRVYRGPRRFANQVDGSDGSHGENYREFATGCWLALVPTQPDMFEIVADAYLDTALFKNDPENSGDIFLGLANLQRFERVLDPIALNRQPGSASEWAGVATGDFDEDGKEEIVALRNFDGNFYMYRLSDSRTIEPVASLTAPGSGSEWMGITAGDFDGDGTVEFAANRNFDGDLYFYRLSEGVIRPVAREYFPKDLRNGILGAGHLHGRFRPHASLSMARNCDGDIFVYQMAHWDDHPIVRPEPGPARP